jgi:hypothetical protein
VVGRPPLHIVYLRVFENGACARIFVQGAWREFGYVYLLRSAASVGPLRGAVTDYFHREESSSSRTSGSSGSSGRLTLRASRRQTRRLLRDVQQRLPGGRSTWRPGPPERAPHPVQFAPPHAVQFAPPQYSTEHATEHRAPPPTTAPRWPRAAAVLLVVAMAVTSLYQTVGLGG